MDEKELKLYKLAKFTNLEIVLESQVQSSGANQARLMEKFKKNKNSIKHQAMAMRFAYALMFGMVAFIPVVNYFQLLDFINSGSISSESVLFAGSTIFGIFFGMQLMYLTFMGMFSIGALMSGEIFQWYETLPLSKNKLRKLGFLTVVRNLDLAFIMMILSFPIVMAIVSLNILLVLVSALISIIDVIFAFSILILVAERISRVLKVQNAGSRKSTMIRIFTMLGYVVVIMSASLVIQWAISEMDTFFIFIAGLNVPYWIIFLTSIIPFPFAPGYLITMLMDPSRFPAIQWVPTIIGMILLVLITRMVYKKAVKSMRTVTSPGTIEIKQTTEFEKTSEFVKDISVRIKTPIKSYIIKDLSSTTRDIQTFMFLIMPIIMPFLLVFVFVFIPSSEFGTIQEHLLMMWSFLMLYQPIIALMIITGFLNMEDSGASIKASLPINPRDQIKAKLIILLTIQSLSFFLPIIVIMLINPAFQTYFLLFISWYPITLVFLLSGLLMKLKMFGRMKYKFVMEEVNPEKKVQKWAFLITTEVLIYLIYAIFGGIILVFSNILLMSTVLFLTSSMILVFLFISLNRMFPKSFGQRVMISIREGFRKQPIRGALVLLLIYAIFLFIPALIELPLIFLPIPFMPAAIIDFLITFTVMAFLWLFLVPRVLHMPNGNEKIKEFSYSINLRPTRSLFRNVIIGIGCSIIFFLSTYIMANIFGIYTFDLDVIFGNPSLSPLRFGWLYFIIMLIPGIWEEVSFRGVITTLHLRKYSELTSLILVSILFGLFHFINLLTGQPLVTTIIQVMFASILGILLGYLFIKTRSLIPSIILHYLIDSAGQLFMNAYFTDMGSFFLFAVLGIGVFPTIFGITFTYLVMKLGKNHS